MLNAPWMIEEMVDRGRKVMEYAQATAPVYEGTGEDPHRGRYKGSFRLQAFAHGGRHHDRAEARITNDAPEAKMVEYGGHVWESERGEWRFQEGHHTLRNALYAAMGGNLPSPSRADEVSGTTENLRQRDPRENPAYRRHEA
jgi:hypothetical protein